MPSDFVTLCIRIMCAISMIFLSVIRYDSMYIKLNFDTRIIFSIRHYNNFQTWWSFNYAQDATLAHSYSTSCCCVLSHTPPSGRDSFCQLNVSERLCNVIEQSFAPPRFQIKGFKIWNNIVFILQWLIYTVFCTISNYSKLYVQTLLHN